MTKIVHFADSHIGSWRDPKLTQLNFSYFSYVIDYCLKNKIEVVLLAGDLFNTSLPTIDYVDMTVKKLMELKLAKIKVYAIAGSHDYSPSGKTMLKILESAGLIVNVLQGEVKNGKLLLNLVVDEDYKLQLTGMFGKKGTLEKNYYEALDYNYIQQQLKEDYYKIFLFHSAITELKPKGLEDMPSSPLSFLPENFNYYAGGHVHYRFMDKIGHCEKIVYPGPTFPNNFKELYDLKTGSFVVFDTVKNSYNFEEIKLKEVMCFNIDLNNKTPDEINFYLVDYFRDFDLYEKIILVKLVGKIDGMVGDINFRNFVSYLEQKNPFCILKNSFYLESHVDEIKDFKVGSIDEIEDKLISENFENKDLIYSLINVLSSEKQEGETNTSFEERILKDLDLVLFEKN